MSLHSNPAPDIHYAAMEMWNALKTSATDRDACQLRSAFMRRCVILDDPELQSDVQGCRDGDAAVWEKHLTRITSEYSLDLH